MSKPITRDDLLARIPEGSPYEAVIVAAREARRLNRIRIAQRSLLAPPSGFPGMLGGAPIGDEGGVAEGIASSAETAEVPARPTAEAAPGIFPGIPRPEDRDSEEKKVTIEALERLSEGRVEYDISESLVEPEED